MKFSHEINIRKEIENNLQITLKKEDICVLCTGIGKTNIKLFGSVLNQLKKGTSVYILRANTWRKTESGYMYDSKTFNSFEFTSKELTQKTYTNTKHYSFDVNHLMKKDIAIELAEDTIDFDTDPLDTKPPEYDQYGYEKDQNWTKFSKAEYAAIFLKSPTSGTKWLDDMITKSLGI